MSLTPRTYACLTGAAVAALAVALAAPAQATVKESRLCRVTIGNQAGALVRTGFRLADKCHLSKNGDCTPAASGGCDREDCLVSTSAAFDPVHAFLFKKTEAETQIDGKCAPLDPVASNYTGGDIPGEVIGAIEDDVEGSSSAVQGVADLECDLAKTTCLKAIGKARTDIIKDIMRDAVRCQKGIDRLATTFGPLEPACLIGTPSAGVAARSTALIASKCTGLTGADVGSCDPLPGCVTGAATSTGQSLAMATYASNAVQTQECGNSVTEGTEQCDDGNTMSGDGCSATCESEGDTCDGTYTGIGATDGTRRVTVILNTPSALGGVEVSLDYPQFQTGIPGIGNSTIVNSRLTMLQPSGLSGMNDSGADVKLVLVNLSSGFSSGNLAQIDFDNCASAATRLCNRTQNIMNCCNDVLDTTQFKRCENGTTPCTTNNACVGIGAGICGPTRCTDGTTACTTDAGCPMGQLCQNAALVICDGNPPACTDQPVGLGVCNNASHVPNGGCPGDNSCVDQSGIMTCRVSNPSDLSGQSVDGVSCSVAVVELP